MTFLESPTVESGITDAVRARLQSAPAPLKLAAGVKNLATPRRVEAAPYKEEVRKLLEEDSRLGRAFCYPSGKKDELRYWSRDEKQILREKALDLAATPQPISTFRTKLGKEV